MVSLYPLKINVVLTFTEEKQKRKRKEKKLTIFPQYIVFQTPLFCTKDHS